MSPTLIPTLAPSQSPTFCGKGGKSGSGKGGKSGAFDDDYYYDDDRRRLRKSSDSSVNKVPAGDRILSEPDAMKVRRRKIYGGDWVSFMLEGQEKADNREHSSRVIVIKSYCRIFLYALFDVEM